MKLFTFAAKTISLITLALAFNLVHADAHSPAQRHIFSLLNNSHPVTAQPVIVADGIDEQSLNVYLQNFSTEYSGLGQAEKDSVGALYLNQILTLPFRIGWQAAHYLPVSYLRAEDSSSPRIQISQRVASEVVFKFVIENFAGLTTADGAFAINYPHLRTVIDLLSLTGTVADSLNSEQLIPAWRGVLNHAHVAPDKFVRFMVDLGFEVTTAKKDFLENALIRNSLHHLGQSPNQYGHARAHEIEQNHAEIVKALECQEQLRKRFFEGLSGQ